MIRIKLLLIFLSFAFTLPTSKPDDIIGTWLTHSGNGKIMIFKTGNYFYGKIAWMRNPNDEAGKPKVDAKNPDAKLRSRHILGSLILKGFEYDDKNNEWINGEIYDPKSGKNYSCTLKLTDHNTLEVHGYIGISLIGRTEIWTRIE